MSFTLSSAIESGALTLADVVFGYRGGFITKMTSSTSTATPRKHAFEARVADVKSPKRYDQTTPPCPAEFGEPYYDEYIINGNLSEQLPCGELLLDINALILDYLTMEGYPKAAAKFSKEANLEPQLENSSIQARQEIQHAIHTGSIEHAIEALNHLDPQILDQNPKLHFSLLRLQLVELIRQCTGGDITAALDFASQNLAPRASTNQSFLEDLEKTMTLLIFPHDESLNPELAALLKADLRRNVADEVNKSILSRQTGRREAAIRDLVKMRAWAETSARNKRIALPDRIDLGLNGEDNDAFDEGMRENEHESMITT